MRENEIKSAIAMVDLGRRIGEKLHQGDLIFLEGDLGAGKTTLTQGIAQGVDVSEAITSPTFQLLKSYQGREILHHLDLYRLKNEAELMILEPEILVAEGIVVVEWGDLLMEWLQPKNYLKIRIELDAGLTARRIYFEPHGERVEEIIKGFWKC